MFIGGKIGQENAFYCTLEMKNTFLEYKSKNLKSLKIGIFFKKGLILEFSQKFEKFLSFYFRQNRPLKYVLRYYRKEKRLSKL